MVRPPTLRDGGTPRMRRHPAALCLAACLLCATRAAPGPEADDRALLDFFRRRTARADQQRVRELVAQLGSRSFAERSRASAARPALGARPVPRLRRAAASPDAEVRRRAEECLRAIELGDDPARVTAAARRLAARKPAGAAEALLDFLPSVLDEAATEEVFAAVAAVTVRDGRPERAVLDALADAEPLRRACAAVALCRAGVKEKRAAVVALLKDT